MGSLFKMTAQELFDVKRKNERQFEEKVAEALWTLTNFSVTAKVETFNGSPKLKFTVHFAERVWEEEESFKILMKKSLGLPSVEKLPLKILILEKTSYKSNTEPNICSIYLFPFVTNSSHLILIVNICLLIELTITYKHNCDDANYPYRNLQKDKIYIFME